MINPLCYRQLSFSVTLATKQGLLFGVSTDSFRVISGAFRCKLKHAGQIDLRSLYALSNSTSHSV